jgi:hypothetical protein
MGPHGPPGEPGRDGRNGGGGDNGPQGERVSLGEEYRVSGIVYSGIVVSGLWGDVIRLTTRKSGTQPRPPSVTENGTACHFPFCNLWYSALPVGCAVCMQRWLLWCTIVV